MLAEVAERSGLSIAAGGVVTALGTALVAVGLAQTAETNPLCNWWVRAGLSLAILGVGWVLWSFALALLASAKNRAVHDALGVALAKGEGLRRHRLGGTPLPASVEDWADRTRELILSGLGGASVAYFDAHAGGAQPDPEVQPQEKPLAYHLTRLKELMERPIRARLDFPTKRRWFDGFEARHI